MNTQRLYGLDLIRLVAFFAIASFHISLIHYHTADIAIAQESWIIRVIEQVSRVLSFSGFTIAFMTSLLTAYSTSRLTHRIRLFSFLIFGWYVFSILMFRPNGEILVWDIYPLLFSGILSATLFERYLPKNMLHLGLFGFCILWIPFWELFEFYGQPNDLVIVLGLASCRQSGIEWPVLPWIGLTWFGYAAGYLAKQHLAANPPASLNIERKEGALWTFLLVLSTLGLGSFYRIRLGGHFSCEAYRQPPVLWWAHFGWVVFLVRLSFDARIQELLAHFKICRWISNLAISRKFWLAYFLNYLLAHVLSRIVDRSGVEETAWNVPVIATIGVLFLPLTEVVTSLTLKLSGLAVSLVRKKDR
jgi:hypothetical protein